MKITTKLDNVKAMVDKLEEKVVCNRIEGLVRAAVDQKEDIEVLIAKSIDFREGLDQNEEHNVN